VAGTGSTPLHYAACGGNVACCQVCTAISVRGERPQNLNAENDRSKCRRFETGGSLSRRVSVPRAPAQMGRARGRARRGESEVAGDGRERGGNPAAFVFVPRPGRVRLQ
jgi:hypothetical protein